MSCFLPARPAFFFAQAIHSLVVGSADDGYFGAFYFSLFLLLLLPLAEAKQKCHYCQPPIMAVSHDLPLLCHGIPTSCTFSKIAIKSFFLVGHGGKALRYKDDTALACLIFASETKRGLYPRSKRYVGDSGLTTLTDRPPRNKASILRPADALTRPERPMCWVSCCSIPVAQVYSPCNKQR